MASKPNGGQPAEGQGIRWKPGMAVYERNENGEIVPFASGWKRRRKPLTEEERERERERRRQHHTRAWYGRQLLAIMKGELVLKEREYRALIAYGRLRGWNRRSPSKR